MNTKTADSVGTPLELAADILNRPVCLFGPRYVGELWGIKISKELVPPILFTPKELEKAGRLQQSLGLQIKAFSDGTPFTMDAINKRLKGKLGNGKLFYNTDWYATQSKQPFYFDETPVLGWRLMGRTLIPGSTGVNYLVQNSAIVEYLTRDLYPDEEMPAPYRKAIEEFGGKKSQIEDIIGDGEKQVEAENMLANLLLTEYFRPTAVEFTNHVVMNHKINGVYLYPDKWVWTKSRSSRSGLVVLGDCVPFGVSVLADDPRGSDSNLGVCLSRSASPTLVT